MATSPNTENENSEDILLKKHVFKSTSLINDSVVTAEAIRAQNKRRVQIPLSRFFETKMKSLSLRFGMKSNASVIQLAIGVLYSLVLYAEETERIFIEGNNGNKILSPLVLMGIIQEDYQRNNEIIKYQVMLNSEQDKCLSFLIDKLQANSVAEVTRYAIRILDNLSRNMDLGESIILVLNNDKEVQIDLC